MSLKELSADTPASRFLFKETGRIRWANRIQKELFEDCEAEVGSEVMLDAVVWALRRGVRNVPSIVGAAQRIHKKQTKYTPRRIG